MRMLLSVVALGVLWMCLLASPVAAVADAGAASPFEGKWAGTVGDYLGLPWDIDIKIEKDGSIKGGAVTHYLDWADYAGRIDGAVDDAGSVMDLVIRLHYGHGAGNGWSERPFQFAAYVSGGELQLYDYNRDASYVLTRR